GARRVVHPADDPADLVPDALRHAVVQVVPAEPQRRAVRGLARRRVDARDVELPVAGVDGPPQDDAVADLPALLLGQLVTNDGALAVLLPRLPLLRRHYDLVVDLEEALRVDGEGGEEPLLVARVLGAEPV